MSLNIPAPNSNEFDPKIMGANMAVVMVSPFGVNRWRWLQIRLSVLNNTFTSNIRQLNRLAEIAPKSLNMPAPNSNEFDPKIMGANMAVVMVSPFGAISGNRIQVIQSQLVVNRWRWLQIRLSVLNNTFTSNIRLKTTAKPVREDMSRQDIRV
jgi:hypothetical protein